MNSINVTIDRGSMVPIAEQISGQLLRRILEGQIENGQRLPAERDLAVQAGVTRGTVKRAYSKLAQNGAIEMHRGSGSYAFINAQVLEENQKKKAAEIIASTITRLHGIGLTDREILNLMHLRALSLRSRGSLRKVSIMIVSNNHEILSELEQQLSYLTDSSPFLFTLSFVTLDIIAGSPDPVQMLLGYDMIVATSIDYPAVLELAHAFRSKVTEARLSPRTSMLMQLSRLPADSKFSVIYRTEIFRKMVERCLLSLGFSEESISYWHEYEYNPVYLGENGVSVVIGFNESPVIINPAFKARNNDFLQSGGLILRFEYRIERNSLLQIEDQIQQLLDKDKK